MLSKRTWNNKAVLEERNNISIIAFTLLEVILAVSISIGMMAVALYFYQQSATLRRDALNEIERISVVRLVMDRVGMELHCAVNGGDLLPGLKGTSNSLEFIRLDSPVREGIITNDSFTISFPKMLPTYCKTTYRLSKDGVSGLYTLEREENKVSVKKFQQSSQKPVSTDLESDSLLNENYLSESIYDESVIDTNSLLSSAGVDPEDDLENTESSEEIGSSASDFSPAGDILWSSNTNLRDGGIYVAMEGYINEGTNIGTNKISLNNVIAKDIGYFRLRYYDGSQWVNSWNKKNLPLGVEIVMAAENPELNNSADEEFFSSAEGETQDMLQDEGNSADIYSKNTSIWEGNEGNYESLIPDTLESEFDTNVVVFRRIIYLPNAKRTDSFITQEDTGDNSQLSESGTGGIE